VVVEDLDVVEELLLRFGSGCRKYGVSEQTFYRWRRKYGGLDPGELERLEDENRKLKQLVAELPLDKHVRAGAAPAPARSGIRPASPSPVTPWSERLPQPALLCLPAALGPCRSASLRDVAN
jgi:hypothetical protein